MDGDWRFAGPSGADECVVANWVTELGKVTRRRSMEREADMLAGTPVWVTDLPDGIFGIPWADEEGTEHRLPFVSAHMSPDHLRNAEGPWPVEAVDLEHNVFRLPDGRLVRLNGPFA